VLTWSVSPLTLDLKYTWKISRNASDQKTNLIISVTDGRHTGKGEAAPNVRYDESAQKGLEQFGQISSQLDHNVFSVEDLRQILKDNRIFNSLAFGIESAWFAYQASVKGQSIPSLLAIEPVPAAGISYTIPIMETGLIKSFYEEYGLARFPFIKLKVNTENAFEAVKHLLSFCRQPVMVDANESFIDVEQCIHWLEKMKRFPLVLVEQPLPSNMADESVYMKKHSPFPVFADEAMTDQADFGILKKSFDGVNMKLMKAGGFINGLRLLREAKKNNLKTMIGCMVETTLGISSALLLCSLADYADLDSFLLVVNDPFGIVEEENGMVRFVKEKGNG
jgi:L-alanine-DL-glutamate epimerase-like enolase superfamily enzyme